MRKITQQAADAFNACVPFTKDNTSVIVDTTLENLCMLTLHGNVIAKRDAAFNLKFTLAGWPTVTTRERLKGIGIHIVQRKGEQYLVKRQCMTSGSDYIELDPYKWYTEDGVETESN